MGELEGHLLFQRPLTPQRFSSEHLWSGAGRVLLRGACSQTPALFTEQGRMGRSLCQQETSILRLPGPWGLPPSPEYTPQLWEVPLHPLQHRLWSGLPGPCLSPGHPVSPTWALTSCPSAFKASLLLWSALLTSPQLSSSLPPQGSAPCPVSMRSHSLGCPLLHHTQHS